jgi:hypothetical protein
MSFATGDSSSSEDDSSGSELDLPYEETGDDCLAPVGSQPVVTKVGGSLPRSTGRQGSPWRESPLSLAMAAEEQDRSVVIKPPKRATRIKREKTIPEHGEEMETVDDNAMYTKGTAEVALPSRIEREHPMGQLQLICQPNRFDGVIVSSQGSFTSTTMVKRSSRIQTAKCYNISLRRRSWCTVAGVYGPASYLVLRYEAWHRLSPSR